MTARSAFLLTALALPANLIGEGLLEPLSAAQARQARKLLAEFKANPKGPFFQIRWFCKDGSEHPAAGTPCASRGGGGRQHATLSAGARQLAGWNIDVGTVLASLEFEQLLDTARDHHRLKELVLEKYLTEIDQGWIYRRAVSYRGARQAEDEEKAGRQFLIKLLSDPHWSARNYFLAGQLVAVIPHGAPDGLAKRIRNLAASIATVDARFQSIRAKIHSAPGPEDLRTVSDFLAQREPAEPARKLLADLVTLLEQERTRGELAARLPAIQKSLSASPLAPLVQKFALRGTPEESFAAGAVLSFAIQQQVTTSQDGRRNLELLDLNALLHEAVFRTPRAEADQERRERIARLLDHLRYAAGAGLLSLRQFQALSAEIAALNRDANPRAEHAAILYLARSTEWCRATAARFFGPVARHYQDVEPLASALVDHLLRSSVALSLSNLLERLVADANRAVGIRHSILGDTSSRGIVGMNPGVATGRLGIVEQGQESSASIDPRGIYVIPETASDLKPMAGILTLDSGNALSHSQLLAANLGIPNATIPSSLLPMFRRVRDQELFFSVSQRGVVTIRALASLTPAERTQWLSEPESSRARLDLDTSRLNLSDTRLRALGELRAGDAGALVGPKAANLGQLASFFPQRVAPGVVIPFGIYWEHIRRTLPGDTVPLDRRISDALAEAERLRQSGADPAAISRFVYPRLAEIRKAIESMPLLPAFEKDLAARLQRDFGADGSFGVFVRSDTNAEDLPGFTGAGLNLTVPNQVGLTNILQAIKDVWASPFTERAYDWRSRILRASDRVYPSVILMRAVPSDKSGVVATVNLETGNTAEITVNMSEGVSAVVDGGVAESLLLRADGGARLLQQARATYRKTLRPGGGFVNLPPIAGDALLDAGEIGQIRRAVTEVKEKYPPAKSASGAILPWDIELGFERGELRLFQIRPLVRYRELQSPEP